MIAYYVEKEQECEECGREIYIGYYCIKDGYELFCDEDCHYENYKKANLTEEVYLTDRRGDL